ncbi:BAI1-associated protein 3 isoform X2 [Erinaceus europaeus]|uniref:BAI1-associated protein 3 isoform X2 n=1 Tax=Erinaceus europaeus TaxID=9365 RepID=A0A1S3A1X6_ERIEU|nr:BAI1-associated protein 3 isoform X2 [Erinaceus europaeus]
MDCASRGSCLLPWAGQLGVQGPHELDWRHPAPGLPSSRAPQGPFPGVSSASHSWGHSPTGSMSSLLDIKSSVLRQVQTRPSFRRRPEGEPGEPSARAWPPGDGAAFFTQMRQVLRKADGRCHLPRPEVLLRSDSPAPEEPVDPARGLRALTQEEVEMLYEEALYTVLYRAGTLGPDQVDDQEALLDYLQQVFGTSLEEHTQAMERVRRAKAPTFALKVSVVQAKNLLAKDPNGFSDPYCMLGIVPASGTLAQQARPREQRSSPRKSSKHSSPPPTKCVQVTEVKSSTLNPVWNEHFLLEIQDVGSDQLRLDIWDHDDDVSLAEACRKLNEVMGLRGMSRYFKQIVKSARANGAAGPLEDHTDDFLGCLNIPIREVAVAGEDRWFKLEPRSSASRVQGDCQLALKLITTQRDTAMGQRGRAGFLSYLLLLGRLLQFEHRAGAEESNSSSWRGELSGPAATVLCLHGTQSNLSELQLAVLHWQVSSRHHQARTLDYGYLLGLLDDVLAHWDQASTLPQEQEESLADSFSAFSDFALWLLRHLREFFPASNSTAVRRLELLLRCLHKLQAFQLSGELCPFQTQLNSDLAAALKRGNREWYDKLLDAKSPREQPGPQRLAGLVELADAVYEDLQACYSIYADLFHSIVKVDIFTLTFWQLEQLVAEEAWVLTEELSSRMTPEAALGLFELYLTLADIQRFWDCIPGRDSHSLALAGIHTPFLPAVKLWLQVLRDQTRRRLQTAVDVDTLEPSDASSKHSSSAATASLCFSLLQELWARLAWPDPAQAQALGTQLSQDLCEAVLYYTEQLRRKADAQPGATSGPVIEQLCVVLNNVELTRKASRKALRGLAWPEGPEGLQEALPRALLSCGQALEEDLQREAHTVTAHLTSKMVGDVRKYVQHISLSPDSIQSEEAVAPLLKFLDEKLSQLSAALVKEGLSRVLEALWELLLRAILQALGAHRDVSPDFYGRFHFTLEALVSFFHAEGQGLPLESLRDGSYKKLEEELRLHRCSVRECIEQFYLDKLKQRSLEQHRFGRLSVRCHYEVAEQRLAVEVLHAADLPALDANGLSDPFVIVELGPPHIFPLVRSQRTQVKSRTLHPVYDELFHFSVPAEACRRRAACVLFTVMDHDWLSTNDFAGEAALGLGTVTGVTRTPAGGSIRAVQPVTLHLCRPRAQVRSALRMLEGRASREAQDFVKRLKELERSMEGDP